MFQTLHVMFETQYADLALGFSAPATYSELQSYLPSATVAVFQVQNE